MKLRELFNKAVNKNNKQIVLTPKKKLILKYYNDVDELLNTKIKEKLKKW